jgi:ribonuclease D
MTVEYINTPEQLIDFCSRIRHSPWLAVDTEFLREKTYYPQLCLIQVANDAAIACIDPLALDDINPLLDVFYDPGVTLVFHAARQDLELFYLLRDALPAPIFDTQVAVTVFGYGEQIGYGNLVKQCLNVDLDKAHSRTDWTKRPLDPAQIDYAADDVRYLRDIYQQLQRELVDKNRLDWLKDDFATLTDIKSYKPEPDTIWRKIKGAGRLKGVQLAVLQRLAAWREKRALKADRPRRWIMKDDILIDLAKLSPTSLDKFSMVRGLEAATIERHGTTLLGEIKLAKATPKEQWPTIKKPVPLTTQQEAVVDTLLALMRKQCDEQSIAPVAVATRKDIERLVAGESDLPITQGWRREIVGQQLLAFLNGELAITANYEHIITQ